VRLRIDMEDRGGNIELLLPYATIEPIRNVLLQMFMGEKFAAIRSGKATSQPKSPRRRFPSMPSSTKADIPLKQLMKLKVGDKTLPLEMRADALVAVRCGSVVLTEGADGPGRRPRRYPCHQAAAQAQYHLCHVRKGR